jgi:nicotinate-nucleotide adenylyltransferase
MFDLPHPWMGTLCLPPVLAQARRRTVGLLGGSFNPAHEGHRHVSVMALKRLGLDQIWWLVSPQNPLKPADGMAPFGERLRHAIGKARHPRIKVTGLETGLGTRFTVDTLNVLHKRFPLTRFVWLMGADNLAQIDRWAGWNRIFDHTAIAVLARPAYSLRALAGRASHRYRTRRLSVEQSRALAFTAAPAWIFLPIRLMPVSATQLRAAGRGLASPSSPLS